ncbi:MAG: hypothetical protein GY759_01530 [Chloroflexi bacterium]|nr:hypothetical protein [Chloroflexota bacterium]
MGLHADGEWITPIPVVDLQKEWGYELKPTNPDTPQQNGLVERVGGVLMDRARTILLASHLPDMYINDALECVAHTYNLEVGRNGIRKEAFYGHPVTRDHLHVFGCLCFVYDEKNKKPKPKALPAIFVGYPKQRRGWKCMTSWGKVTESRDVTFRDDILGADYFKSRSSSGFKEIQAHHFRTTMFSHLLSRRSPHRLQPPTPQIPLPRPRGIHPPLSVYLI